MGADKLGKLDFRDLISNSFISLSAPTVKVKMLKVMSVCLVSSPTTQYFHLF